MVRNKKNRIPFTVMLIIILFTGCGGRHQSEIKGHYKSTSITSTNNLIFYKIYRDASDSFYKIKKDEYYFCMNNRKDNIADQCLRNRGQARGERLPSGTTIILTGNVVKTESWGIYTIDSGPAPITYFEGKLGKSTIWVADFSLRRIIYNVRPNMIDNTNEAAYEVFKKDIDKF